MSINLSALSNVTTSLTALSNLILVTPQRAKGIKPNSDQYGSLDCDAILFNYEAEQSVTLTSDITDHYVEDNSSVADQIALKPEEITTSGFIGELNNVIPVSADEINILKQKLLVISAYTPELSETAQIALDAAFQLYQLADSIKRSAVQTAASINGSDVEGRIGSTGLNREGSQISRAQTRQQIAFQQFYGYWRNRTLFTVQTPWAIFENMAIKSLRAIQDSETNMITDFEVTFKMIRFASAIRASGSIDKSQYDARLGEQAEDVSNGGDQTPSLADNLMSKIG